MAVRHGQKGVGFGLVAGVPWNVVGLELISVLEYNFQYWDHSIERVVVAHTVITEEVTRKPK